LTPFGGYFAEDQSSANGLIANILEKLYHCAGFVVVMHPRGVVKNDHDSVHIRGSLWIEQEIAIVSLIRQFVRKDTEIKIAAYIHQSIQREGIRDLIQLNAVLFDSDDKILSDLRSKISEWRLNEATAIKNQKWQQSEREMSALGPERVEALRILTLHGASNDLCIMPQLKRMRLAENWYGILEGLSINSNFIQVVPNQPPKHRQRDGERMYKVKPEAKEFLERYFVEHIR
jgi:hypothetical protein